MTRTGAIIIILFITKIYGWFLCPQSSGCGPVPVTSPCCYRQVSIPSQPCCNQQVPLANNCGGCPSSNSYSQAQIYQPRPYVQPQQTYPIPQSYSQQQPQFQQPQFQQPQFQQPQIQQSQYQQPQFQQPIQGNQFIPQQQYQSNPSDNVYPQAVAYVTPSPCYLIGKHKCCNKKLQLEMEDFLTDYEKTGASMCNYHRLANQMQHRLESNFNITFETIVSLGEFESKSYYEGHHTCKFEKRGKIYLAYETPFENPEDMATALEKDLGYPVEKVGYGINSSSSSLPVDRGNFQFGSTTLSNEGNHHVTDIGTSSHIQQKSMFTKSKI